MKIITGFAAYLAPPILLYFLLEQSLPELLAVIISTVYFFIHARYMLKFFDNKGEPQNDYERWINHLFQDKPNKYFPK